MGQGTDHVQRLVETVITGDGNIGQLFVVVDDPARIVATQLCEHLVQRAVFEDQSTLNPGQIGGRIQFGRAIETVGADADAFPCGQANPRVVTGGAQVDIAALHAHLCHAVEVTHGKSRVANAGGHQACIEFQRLAAMGLHLEKRLALIQPGYALLIVDGAGKRRIGVEQDFRAVLQLQALAFTDHGQVIGLKAHGQIAEAEQTEDQHGGGGQGFPVRTQA
ncbi:hypothetical protein D3C73_752590 [compost metagenome]